MALIPVIKDKEKLYKHFQATKHTAWKLYNSADMKTPIQSLTNEKNTTNSYAQLRDIVECLESTGIYVLDSFLPVAGAGEKNYFKPDASVCFTMAETMQQQSQNAPSGERQTIGYTPQFADHIELIKTNAKLASELDYTKKLLQDNLLEVGRLTNELTIANNLLDEYEAEEEDDEDEEEEGLAGMPVGIESAIAQLITKHGPVVIENMFDKKLNQDLKPELEEEEHDNKNTATNGIDFSNMPSIDIIVDKLQKVDPKLQQHLYKLLLIGQQKPNTFKIFLSKLENY